MSTAGPATSRLVLSFALAATALVAHPTAREDVHIPLKPVRVLTPASIRAGAHTALPLSFEDRGDGTYAAQARGYGAQITPGGVHVAVRDAETDTSRTWRWTLVGSRPTPAVWRGARSGDAHYLSGDATPSRLMESGGQTAVATATPDAPRVRSLHAQMGFRDIYPGVDVRYRGTDGHVEQDFLVAPGISPAVIRFRIDQARATLTADGAIAIEAGPSLRLRLEAPRAWQTSRDGTVEPVAVAFRHDGDGGFGFDVGTYDRSRVLVIDPVLTYSMALGGNGAEEATAVAIDAQGRIYLAGYTSSTDLPWQRLGGPGGRGDVFVARLDPTGQQVQFIAYFGGAQPDNVRGLAVDTAGRLHVTGYTTSTDFPMVRPLSGQHLAPGGTNAFVATIAADGSALSFSTYLGGADADEAHGIAVAADGSLVVAGETRSTDFPTRNARQPVGQGLDGFITKITPAGTLDWSTYHGGASSDSLFAVAIDATGAVSVAGTTASADFPVMPASQGAAGGFDAVVARYTASGTLVFSTRLGGSAHDSAQAIAVDAAGAIHVGGSTSSPDFPATHTAGSGGSLDAFAVSYASNGARGTAWRIGGTDIDRARAIAVDATGIYLAGQTLSADFPLLRPVQVSNAGSGDGFVVMLRGAEAIYSTYVGTSSNDDATGVAVDGIGRVVLTGTVLAMGVGNRGPTDAFLFRLSSGDETTDTDNDQLPDAWKTQFNLDPRLSDGNGDPDGDGHTNAQEHTDGTHPRGRVTRLLAEGLRQGGFRTRIALANPSPTTPAYVQLRFERDDAVVVTTTRLVPARQRVTVDASAIDGLRDHAFATVAESDVVVAVDRLVQWDNGRGSHGEHGIAQASRTWYFAEGATYSGFSLFYLLQNPGDTLAHVTVTYLREPPLAPLTRTHEVEPHQRYTVWVNNDEAGPETPSSGAASSVVIESDRPIVAERAMYRSVPASFEAGHAAAGADRLRTSWFFAEGHTGPLFAQYLLIGNPGDTSVPVHVTYLLPDGPTMPITYEVGPRSRYTVLVNRETPSPGVSLASTAVAMAIEADAPVVAERAMWWPGPSSRTWLEAHASLGATQTCARWAVAEGEWATGVSTYVLVANTGTAASTLRVTLLREGAAPLSADVSIDSGARINVDVPSLFPEAFGSRFAMLIEPAPFAPALPLVVEWSHYADTPTVHWSAGANAGGTCVP